MSSTPIKDTGFVYHDMGFPTEAIHGLYDNYSTHIINNLNLENTDVVLVTEFDS